jgi:hypothetical protein
MFIMFIMLTCDVRMRLITTSMRMVKRRQRDATGQKRYQ